MIDKNKTKKEKFRGKDKKQDSKIENDDLKKTI